MHEFNFLLEVQANLYSISQSMRRRAPLFRSGVWRRRLMIAECRRDIQKIQMSLQRRSNTRRRQVWLKRTLRNTFKTIRKLEREQRVIYAQLETFDSLARNLAILTRLVYY